MTANIANEKYVRLTTFTKDGRRKHTPVWIADLKDGTIGFTTGIDSWKVKRIRNTPKIELTPSDVRGRVNDDAQTITGVAQVVTDAALKPVWAAIKKKYGLQMTMITIANKVRSVFGRGATGQCGVVITLDEASD